MRSSKERTDFIQPNTKEDAIGILMTGNLLPLVKDGWDWRVALPLLSESDRRFQPAFELEKKTLESVAPLEQKLELHKFQKTGIVARQQRDDAASDYAGRDQRGSCAVGGGASVPSVPTLSVAKSQNVLLDSSRLLDAPAGKIRAWVKAN